MPDKAEYSAWPRRQDQSRFSVIPTAMKLRADKRYSGRGVTIAFLDSGFYAHPDLKQPTNRILAYKSIFEQGDDPTSIGTIR